MNYIAQYRHPIKVMFMAKFIVQELLSAAVVIQLKKLQFYRNQRFITVLKNAIIAPCPGPV
jgi:hypothetical protein